MKKEENEKNQRVFFKRSADIYTVVEVTDDLLQARLYDGAIRLRNKFAEFSLYSPELFDDFCNHLLDEGHEEIHI